MIRIAIILFCFLLSGCSSVFFFPMSAQVVTPDRLGLEYQDIHLQTKSKLALHGWFLPAKGEAKGSVYFLHGNAENISTHIQSVYWLPEMGYQVFLLDYRGYGLSEGKPDLAGALEDIKTGFNWLIEQESVSGKPVFLLGQSLGASMGIYFAATDDQAKSHLSGVISDAAFARYRDIARHVADQIWLAWALQYPVSWSVVRQYDPVDYIGSISPTPLLLIHSRDDVIIPWENSNALFEAAKEPKTQIETAGYHGMTFNFTRNRWVLLDFFEKFGQ
ncbi:MAG: alpha/beta hydrolase [Gammaproteobacteria bacterium]|nr:MAG: alpha/beta hydrolase [Gammaproteobacteria bacterium]